jgi:hypothetical protein
MKARRQFLCFPLSLSFSSLLAHVLAFFIYRLKPEEKVLGASYPCVYI